MVDFENDIKECIYTLQQGGIILYPTDTVWGLGCDATNAAAVDKVFELKQRPANKSVIVLLADARDILQYVAAPPPDIIAIVDSFQQPTTVVYDNGIELPANVLHTNGSVAIRITTDPFCRALIKRFKKPIVSTSANISGAPGAAIYTDINSIIIDGAGYVVHHRQSETTQRQPSRLVRVDEHGIIAVLRP